MLETVREYGLEQLTTSEADEAVRSAHASYYLDLAERWAPTSPGRLGDVSPLSRWSRPTSAPPWSILLPAPWSMPMCGWLAPSPSFGMRGAN